VPLVVLYQADWAALYRLVEDYEQALEDYQAD